MWTNPFRDRTLTNRVSRLESRMTAAQSDIDALTAKVTTAVTDIQAEIDKLKKANPSINLTGLDAAVQSLSDLDTSNQ